ncbi:MAG: ribosome biogenesis factor YjgA [Gammaproteobacteria bacterium]
MTDADQSSPELPSKTRRKKDAHQQQALGERLAKLKPAELQQIDLPEKLIIALLEYRKLPNSFGARRRQLQFIGKLMRGVDGDEIESMISAFENGIAPASYGKSIPLESIADTILDGNDQTIAATIDSYPQLERQPLRQFLLEYQRASEDRRERIKARLLKHLSNKLSDS